VVGRSDAGEEGLALTVFRALQLIQARNLKAEFSDFVAFDLETTDAIPTTCDVIEIGAVRVRRDVVDRYHTLVKPTVPIAPGATRQHGYREEDVRTRRRSGPCGRISRLYWRGRAGGTQRRPV